MYLRRHWCHLCHHQAQATAWLSDGLLLLMARRLRGELRAGCRPGQRAGPHHQQQRILPIRTHPNRRGSGTHRRAASLSSSPGRPDTSLDQTHIFAAPIRLGCLRISPPSVTLLRVSVQDEPSPRSAEPVEYETPAEAWVAQRKLKVTRPHLLLLLLLLLVLRSFGLPSWFGHR